MTQDQIMIVHKNDSYTHLASSFSAQNYLSSGLYIILFHRFIFLFSFQIILSKFAARSLLYLMGFFGPFGRCKRVVTVYSCHTGVLHLTQKMLLMPLRKGQLIIYMILNLFGYITLADNFLATIFFRPSYPLSPSVLLPFLHLKIGSLPYLSHFSNLTRLTSIPSVFSILLYLRQ